MRKRRSKNPKHARKTLKPKTEHQTDYIRTISECDVTICTGPAGSGKTAVAVGLACEYLTNNRIKKIVITRPIVETGRQGLGFLPGTFDEKVHPYLVPVLEEIGLYFNSTEIDKYKSSKIIEVCPLEYMRGRNFHHSFIILDEAQNATYEQIKMFITRLGWGSKAVINGDIEQSDLPLNFRGALDSCFEKLKDVEGVGLVTLGIEDIVRNDIISKILTRLN